MRLEYFEMIDRITALDLEAGTIAARALVPETSPVFEGHFPGHPLVPGVLLTETMAQASGYLVLAKMDFSHMPFLMAVDKARFRTFVEPRAELAIEAKLEHEGSGYAVTRAKIAVDGRPICEADLRFRTMPFPAGLDAPMRERARQIGLLQGAA